ncbi:hypothetical protein ACJZ2D_005838 [Fusarium nematophilum]
MTVQECNMANHGETLVKVKLREAFVPGTFDIRGSTAFASQFFMSSMDLSTDFLAGCDATYQPGNQDNQMR